jgi:hypothetical protein
VSFIYTPGTSLLLKGAGILLLMLLLAGCISDTSTPTARDQHTNTFVSGSPGVAGTSNQQITYSTLPQALLIRTFYGGGLTGSLSLSPEVSIYGNGTYILGTTQQGKLSSDALQQLLHTVVDTYGLLSMQQQQFADIQDQNATFLELNLDEKPMQFIYGSFGYQHESSETMKEYHQLGQALTAINNALTGPTYPYRSNQLALLVRRDFSPDLTQTIPTWSLSDFTLAQAADFECGSIPSDDTSQNPETGCLKYTIPDHAILLTSEQATTLEDQLHDQQQGVFSEQGDYYDVTLCPLLPDELADQQLAMFGSAQMTYVGVPLLEGPIPPTSTPTS